MQLSAVRGVILPSPLDVYAAPRLGETTERRADEGENFAVDIHGAEDCPQPVVRAGADVDHRHGALEDGNVLQGLRNSCSAKAIWRAQPSTLLE